MTTVIVPCYGYLNNKFIVFLNLSKIAKQRNRSYSSPDELGSNVIAIDTIKKQLLFLKKVPDSSSSLIIDLNNLDSCSIKKQYKNINAGDIKTKKLQDFLASIFFTLRFKNSPGIISIPLYEADKDNNQGNLNQLEKKAKKWQKMISKLLPKQISKLV